MHLTAIEMTALMKIEYRHSAHRDAARREVSVEWKGSRRCKKEEI